MCTTVFQTCLNVRYASRTSTDAFKYCGTSLSYSRELAKMVMTETRRDNKQKGFDLAHCKSKGMFQNRSFESGSCAGCICIHTCTKGMWGYYLCTATVTCKGPLCTNIYIYIYIYIYNIHTCTKVPCMQVCKHTCTKSTFVQVALAAQRYPLYKNVYIFVQRVQTD